MEVSSGAYGGRGRGAAYLFLGLYMVVVDDATLEGRDMGGEGMVVVGRKARCRHYSYTIETPRQLSHAAVMIRKLTLTACSALSRRMRGRRCVGEHGSAAVEGSTERISRRT